MPLSHTSIEPLRDGNYRLIDKAIVGDAPKDFLGVYDYGEARKNNADGWPAYIAKVGQKWYPNESITEQLLTRIGQFLGVDIADSRLMLVRGQLRFLSRYFLKPDESLVHGAEIFSGYLSDRTFVEEVERKGEARNTFTFQFAEQAIKNQFPDQASQIMEGFVKLLGFDALIGNNDRHFYNWGVVTDVHGTRHPRFSPIYDTARALFWNSTEGKLRDVDDVRNPARRKAFLAKYVRDCNPKTGWDDMTSPNHFDLIRRIVRERPDLAPTLQCIDSESLLDHTALLFDEEFAGLITKRRQSFITSCLRLRQGEYRKAIES